jgi:hypothetical protein
MGEVGHDHAFHAEIRADDARWEELPFVGVQQGESYSLELRHCTCGSTIGRRVGEGEPAKPERSVTRTDA